MKWMLAVSVMLAAATPSYADAICGPGKVQNCVCRPRSHDAHKGKFCECYCVAEEKPKKKGEKKK